MKKLYILLPFFFLCVFLHAQELNINACYDWNTVKKSGFFESATSKTSNLPNNVYDWYWGINIAHSNRGTTSSPMYWGGQIAIPINRSNMIPQMYIRSTNESGQGQWAKVLTDKGDQIVEGNMHIRNNIYASSHIQLPMQRQIGAMLNDKFSYLNNEMGHYSLQWLIDPQKPGAGSLWMSAHAGIKFFTSGKVKMTINNLGNVGIGTDNPLANFDIGDTSDNKLKSVLARLNEGKSSGEGTYLGVRSYSTQPVGEKSFSLEHKFYGKLNSSIDFYRGGGMEGGSIGISVNNGKELCRFSEGLINVGGTIKAREVKIEVTAGADHVFESDYDLKPLSEVETFVRENKHLPEIPSEKQMQEEGLSVNEFQIKLLQKIEELTLYVIEQDKKNQILEAELNQLKKQLSDNQ